MITIAPANPDRNIGYIIDNPFSLFVGDHYSPLPGWLERHGQYPTIECAAEAGKRLAEEHDDGWWQIVDLRTLRIVAGEVIGEAVPEGYNPDA